MLTRLQIQNYALIDSIEVEFGGGLTIVTGETGAGKSIILGALSLLLGARADSKSVRDTGRKSIIEAEFEIDGENIPESLESLDVECSGDHLILRREISASGRSRTLINDSVVTLAEMSSIAGQLIDIHSQHKNLSIADDDYRLSVLDAVGGDYTILKEYRSAFRKYVKARSRYKEAEERIRNSKKEDTLLQFQLEQLAAFGPKIGEQRALERRYEMLDKAAEIRERVNSAMSLLSPSEESSAGGKVSVAIAEISRVPVDFFSESDGNPLERLKSVVLELKDIYSILEERVEGVTSSPGELEKINERLDALYKLQLQFKVESEDELAELYKELKEKARLSVDASEELPVFDKAMRSAAAELKECSRKLTESRQAAADVLSRKMEEYGVRLGLKNIRFKAEVSPSKLSPSGGDYVSFLCTFNKNSDMRPVEKIASGGEISRLMLSLKSILAGRMELPTIIFDEIDTGVSGEIADRMGEMMRDISRNIQVIAITHLPQVAAKGNAHIKVYKNDSEEGTFTRVTVLDPEGREQEIARMLSGANLNDAALLNARQLIKDSNK